MKTVTSNRIRWIIPALAALIIGAGADVVMAAPAEENKPKATKAAKPRSKTAEGTFSSANATMVKLNVKGVEMNVNLVLTTEYWRIQTGLPVSALKVGDMVKFTLKGTDDMATVQSLAPLTLKFEDVATLTIDKIGRMKFDRVAKLTATDLVAGQEAKVASNVFPDGKMEAREVWVVIKPTKPEKKIVNTKTVTTVEDDED